jgi:hypothetical protein
VQREREREREKEKAIGYYTLYFSPSMSSPQCSPSRVRIQCVPYTIRRDIRYREKRDIYKIYMQLAAAP